MPVYHFTYHTYRSWNADHPRGWIQHGEQGVRIRSEHLAIHRKRLAKHPPTLIHTHQQHAIIDYVQEICGKRNWEPYGISANLTHLHVVIAWRSALEMEFVRDTLKSLLGYLLAKASGTRGKPWFSHGQDETAVRTMRHLRYLLYKYLPDHPGAFWRREINGGGDLLGRV